MDTKLGSSIITVQRNSKCANLNLDRYSDVSLVQARKSSVGAKEQIAQGIDPQDERKRKQQEYKNDHEHIFLKVSEDWFEIKSTMSRLTMLSIFGDL